MNNHKQYFEYLKNRSLLGRIYRRFFLYPKINRLIHGRLLDVGCGVGDMLAFRPNSIGVDINDFNVKFCQWRGLNVELMAIDHLPFADASFDSVLLDNVLEHIAEPESIINEIKRVMSTDGVLVIGVPGLLGQLSDEDHKVYYDEAMLNKLADKLGFEIANVVYTPLWKSVFLSKVVKQYCIYSQWRLRS